MALSATSKAACLLSQRKSVTSLIHLRASERTHCCNFIDFCVYIYSVCVRKLPYITCFRFYRELRGILSCQHDIANKTYDLSAHAKFYPLARSSLVHISNHRYWLVWPAMPLRLGRRRSEEGKEEVPRRSCEKWRRSSKKVPSPWRGVAGQTSYR